MKKTLLRLAGVVLVVCLLMVGLKAFEQWNDEMDTPVITPYENVTLQVGKSILVEDLTNIENEVSFWISSADSNLVTVSEDGSEITAGNRTGEVKVTIAARGPGGKEVQKVMTVTVVK